MGPCACGAACTRRVHCSPRGECPPAPVVGAREAPEPGWRQPPLLEDGSRRPARGWSWVVREEEGGRKGWNQVGSPWTRVEAISYAALTRGKLRGGFCPNFALRLHSSLSGSAVDYTFRSSREVGGRGVSRTAQLPELGLRTTTFCLRTVAEGSHPSVN